jgi:hypothetical protein
MTDFSKPYCTYLTSHPTGFYYIGKGQTERILAGEYLGSGAKLNAAFNHMDFTRDSWSVQITETFSSESDAYEAERHLITRATLSDPYCLNLAAGGSDGKPLSTMIKSGEYAITDSVNQQSSNLSIDGIVVGMDSQGRFSLTDLWRASQTAENKKPYFWLRTDSTKEIIQELVNEKQKHNTSVMLDSKHNTSVIQHNTPVQNCISYTHPINTVNGVGSFGCRELVYSYAMWISPAFHLKVIRAYDNSVLSTNTVRSCHPENRQALGLIANAVEIGQALGVSERDSLRVVRTEVKRLTGVDLSKFIKYM